MNRRQFLEASAGAVAAIGLAGGAGAEAQQAGESAAVLHWPENGTLIPDEGWRLWVDREAEWKQDEIFLPADVSQDADGVVRGKGQPLPVNAPTGGWGVLDGKPAGAIEVDLPGTVEQHFWGKFGAGADAKPRSYTPEEYRYAADDPVPQNGAYFGVSWWWREIEIPASMQGKRIFLHVRGAHLRAEVYLNEKLVGYSIMEELPFEAELTHAAKPGGKNVLAIRITNPFGRFDWVDGLNAQWGAVKLYRSHGFGGLDRGMTISAHGPIRIKDAWVLNTPQARKAIANVTLEGTGVPDLIQAGSILCKIQDPATGKTIATVDRALIITTQQIKSSRSKVSADSGASPVTHEVSDIRIDIPSAELWELAEPKLYHLSIECRDSSGNVKDFRTIAFGFRTFAPEGLGTDAMFRLNGRRMKIYTAISWGYWGINGMWPTPELAVKEVTQAKKLNLTCLNFHRNLAKEDVLRAHDRLGLLRYMEPGAGKMAIGKMPAGASASSNSIVMEKVTDPADKFAQRYMFTKCVEMVKAFRSHPSVIEYCLQNEIGADLKNPDTLAVLKAMHDEDPSRCVVLNDGFVARGAAQAWYEPWDSDLKTGKLHRSDEEKWGGWWNQHQGAGDQWYDAFYKGPDDFTYKAPFRDVITEFGEMEGCATPDNHALMLHELDDPKGTGIGNQPPRTSYDYADHKTIEDAASAFLTRWGFREAFPATEKLWTALGKKCYDTWQNYLENARISDELDFAAISGWESTAIENHSGIVDNLRNFKSDPTPISATLLPVRPVAKQRSACSSFDEDVVFDLFLLNDTGKPVSGELVFTVTDPKGNRTQIGRYPVPQQSPDQFSYLVKEAVAFRPKLNKTVPYGYEGLYRFRFALTSEPSATQSKDIWITFKELKEVAGLRVAVSGVSNRLREQIRATGPLEGMEDFKVGEKYDVIISSGMAAGVNGTQNAGDTTGLETQPTGDTGAVNTTKQVGHIDEAVLEAVKAGTPLLVIPQADTLSDGVAKQLADAGAFAYSGNVGDYRAPWMGNWYFVRKHLLYEGMPVDQAMGFFYQAPGREANGLLVDRAPGGAEVEIVAAYSRDHDRRIGAGTFTTKLGKGKVVYHRVPTMHPVLQSRFLANALRWLAG